MGPIDPSEPTSLSHGMDPSVFPVVGSDSLPLGAGIYAAHDSLILPGGPSRVANTSMGVMGAAFGAGIGMPVLDEDETPGSEPDLMMD